MSPDAVRRPSTPVRLRVWDGIRLADRPDRVVTEEPLEIRLAAPDGTVAPLAVVMRTPGHDFELAAGLCLTEGVVDAAADIREVRYCLGPDVEQRYNVVTVETRAAVDVPARTLAASASCGVCGKASIEDLAVRCAPVAAGPEFPAAVLGAFPEVLRAGQRLFAETGGLHAAGLTTPEGELQLVREDVGRHNAVDKLVGHALLEGRLPLAGCGLAVSGRVSFEIVQKAARAGIPLVAAVSAPSSLAIATAARLGLTLVGFVRGGRLNVYTGAERIAAD